MSEIVSRQDKFMRQSIESSGRKQASTSNRSEGRDRESIVIDRRVVLVDKSTDSKNMTILVDKYSIHCHRATKSKGLTFVSLVTNVAAMNISNKHLHLEML
jgi:hypothetical protein